MRGERFIARPVHREGRAGPSDEPWAAGDCASRRVGCSGWLGAVCETRCCHHGSAKTQAPETDPVSRSHAFSAQQRLDEKQAIGYGLAVIRDLYRIASGVLKPVRPPAAVSAGVE